MVVKSWSSEETLELLATKYRNGEIVNGVIRSLSPMSVPKVGENNEITHVKENTLIVALPGGVTGYCPVSEFKEREFRSLNRFVGTPQSFVITRLDLDNQLALLSEKKAAAQLRDVFWDELTYLQSNESLENEIFEAVVTSINRKNGVIHVNIQGQDAYIYPSEWSWVERGGVDAQVGEKIQVIIEDFDKEEKMVRASRKKALPDPFDFLTKLKRDDIIAGKVVNVHTVHGLFVEVENGVVLKAGKPRKLEQPDIGDIVTCRVHTVDADKRRGKVYITGYPKGKRKKVDIGSFLFE